VILCCITAINWKRITIIYIKFQPKGTSITIMVRKGKSTSQLKNFDVLTKYGVLTITFKMTGK